MRIVLTGATGYLGSRLAKALHHDGHQVVVLKRSFSDSGRIADILPEMAAYDVDRSGLEAPFVDHGPIDALIHTATCYGRSGESPSEIFEANTAFPLRLLQTAAAFGVETFFNTDTGLDRSVNPYSLSKKQFTEWGKLYAGQERIRFVTILLEHFYGPGDDDTKFVTHVIKSCLRNEPRLSLTRGEQRRDFIHIDDVVSAYRLLLEKAGSGIRLLECGLGSGVSVPLRELVETVHDLAASKTLLDFGAIPYRENEVMESRADISVLAELGWACTVPLAEGLARTVELEALDMKGREQ